MTAALLLLNIAIWVWAAFALSAAQPAELRLARYAGGASGLAIVADLTGSPLARLLQTLTAAMRRRRRFRTGWSPHEIAAAGIDLARVDAMRVLLTGLAAATLLLPGLVALQSALVLLGASLAGAAWLTPGLMVGMRLAERRARILQALPDTLDLLSVAMSAGQSLDRAIALVVVERSDPLGELLRAAQQEIRIGRPRADALRSVGERSGVIEVHELAGHLIRSIAYGASLADTLRVEAAHMRSLVRQRAREKAGQATVKLLFPLVLFYVPVLFLITVGPVLVRLLQSGALGVR